MKLWRWWHYPVVLILILFFASIGYGVFDPSFVKAEIEHHGSMWWVGAVLGTIFVVGLGLLLVYLFVSAPFLGMALKLDREWVEVWDRGLDWKKRHFRGPLENYTAVVLRYELTDGVGTAAKYQWPVYGVELHHPEDDKNVPLYRGNEKTARLRWKNAAREFGIPATTCGRITNEASQ